MYLVLTVVQYGLTIIIISSLIFPTRDIKQNPKNSDLGLDLW